MIIEIYFDILKGSSKQTFRPKVIVPHATAIQNMLRPLNHSFNAVIARLTFALSCFYIFRTEHFKSFQGIKQSQTENALYNRPYKFS